MFITGEEDEGKGKESSNSKEHIVDTGNQETENLPSLSDVEKQKEHATSQHPSTSASGSAEESHHQKASSSGENLSTQTTTTISREAIDAAPPEAQTSYASYKGASGSEVTRLLRTTRRGELNHDDRHYITQCCNSLESAGFDASWLNYVRECMKECDEAEAEMDMVKTTLEETERKASNLKNELASVQASLHLLRHKASMLRDFIQS
ncbi:uncharacterized protein G2W53_002447 [Senna tora]|uniref:Uncharacterized protein n=1 Tax=Senna tora TaxID=362788 RepID=A0A834XKJ8_9FABA|nr:uncharacterized protein G2W53_002447 [Senna tora]